MMRQPQRSTLFPYRTLFRSRKDVEVETQRITEPVTRTRVEVERRAVPADRAAVYDADASALREGDEIRDRKSTRLNSSHANISYAVFCLKKHYPQLCSQHRY